MPTREEMIAELSKGSSQRAPSREEMIAELAGDLPKQSTLERIGNKIDSYTGAPTRAGIVSLIESPSQIRKAASEFGKHFGGDARTAPSNKDLTLKLGVNDNPAELTKAVNDPKSAKGFAIKTLANLAGPGLGDLIAQGGSRFLDSKGTTNADIASVPIGMAADWTNAVGPVLSLGSKAIKGIKGLKAAEKIAAIAGKAEDVAQTANTAAQNGGNIVKLGAAADSGLNATDAIKLANEGADKINIKEIAEASKRLGFEPTKGMLTTNPTIKGLESSLEQSPSVAGALVRNQTDKVRRGVTKAVEGLTKDTTSYSKFELGEQIKSGIMEKIAQRHAPIADQFNKLRESTAFIEVPDKSKLTLAQNFMKHPDVALAPNSSWGSKAQQFGDYLLNAKSADDVKRLRTIVGKEIQASTNPNEQRVLNSIYGSLTRLEENTIKRAAIATARTSTEGAQIGTQMLGELKTAKQGFRGLMTDIADVTKAGSLKKSRTIEDFIDIVDNVPSEKIGDVLFKTNDLRSLKTIEKLFPNEFSLMRQQKVSELVEKSLVKGQLDPAKFARAVKNIGPEVMKKIFGGNADAVLKDVQTVLDARPNMMGPSGTPQGQMFMNMLDLPFQGKEMLRFGAYKKLQNPTIPIEQVKNMSIPFKKAGQVSTGGLSDLINGANKAKLGINAVRSVNEAINKPQK